MRKEFIDRIKAEEGFTAKSFWDDAPGGGGGQWTWGYGTKANGPNQFITMEQAEVELIKELILAESDYGVIFQTAPPNITQVRYECLVDMIFNLGLSRFSGFHNTIAAIRSGDWEKASLHAQQSLWYKQVGNRAKRIVNELRTGVTYGTATGEEEEGKAKNTSYSRSESGKKTEGSSKKESNTSPNIPNHNTSDSNTSDSNTTEYTSWKNSKKWFQELLGIVSRFLRMV